MGARRRPELAGYYEILLTEQEESGLSVSEFAEEAGVSSATLYSWRRRLRGANREAQVVEVSVVDEGPPAERGGSLTLQVGGRFEVVLAADFDEVALRRLLGVLQGC